jgi:hypothetical protein
LTSDIEDILGRVIPEVFQMNGDRPQIDVAAQTANRFAASRRVGARCSQTNGK